MYQRILVPLDGSGFSECVFKHVKAIALGCGVPELVLLQVLEPITQHQVYELLGDYQVRDIQNQAQASTETYVSQQAEKLKNEGLTVRTAVVSGNPSEEILDFAGKNQVDLIIMSTHGRSGVSRWVMGSVTGRVLRHSMVPVLAVSPPGCRGGQ